MTPENHTSVEAEPLSQMEQDVQAHWEQFRPTLVRDKAEGPDALDTALTFL